MRKVDQYLWDVLKALRCDFPASLTTEHPSLHFDCFRVDTDSLLDTDSFPPGVGKFTIAFDIEDDMFAEHLAYLSIGHEDEWVVAERGQGEDGWGLYFCLENSKRLTSADVKLHVLLGKGIRGTFGCAGIVLGWDDPAARGAFTVRCIVCEPERLCS